MIDDMSIAEAAIHVKTSNIKKLLTDRTIRALKPALAGTRWVIRDAKVPGLAVRVTDLV
jgi:hypothetical protein